MSYVYTAKTPATATQTTPTGWWPGWTFPSTFGSYDPWPPAWPMATTAYTLSVTIPADITAGATVATVARILKAGVDTADLNLHLISIQYTRADTGAIVQCKKTAGGSWANGITYQATNYTGARYGVSQSIYVNTTGLEGVVLVCTATIVSVSPVVTGGASGTITGASDVTYAFNLGYHWTGQGVTWPTLTIQSITTTTGYTNAAKSIYGSGAFDRVRGYSGFSPAVPIPATTITGAVLNADWVNKDTTLEDFISLDIYLAADGASPVTLGTYDPSGLSLLASVASGALAAGVPVSIALNVATLNANAGKTMHILMVTSVEAAAGGVSSAPDYQSSGMLLGTLSTPWAIVLSF